ncbi:MAG: hypothetical protein II937_03310 [Bacteroidales bacterium]|nr:hypothetical protein [Bacteroidales bacterium]
MERKEQKEVVNNVTTVKMKYVKPDFEVYELNWEAPLLMGSGGNGATINSNTNGGELGY